MLASNSSRILAYVLITSFIGLIGCNAAVVEPTTVSGEEQRDTSVQVSEKSCDQVIAGNNEFAFELYQAISAGDKNLFFSPQSLSTTLAMVYAGAKGETETQMRDTLQYRIPQDELHPIINRINLDLTSLTDNGATEGFELRVANSIWAQQGYPFLSTFLTTLATNYGQDIRLVDYQMPQSRELARQQINQWASKETSGLIPEFLEKGLLTVDSRLTLVNAVYFKGLWQSPFDKPTRPGKFQLLDGKSISVPMMEQRFDVKASKQPDYEAVEIPYRGDRARMLVVVPTQGTFEQFEKLLNPKVLSQIRNSLQLQDINFYLPKFKFEAELDLAQVLSEMGMPLAFDQDGADFSGMDGSRRLFLKDTIHKAIVKVNEEGTEAAAASAATMEIVSMPQTILVGRPFIFCIYDTQRGNLIFLGRVLDPRN